LLKVAVELPGEFESAGEWLADAQAMEAAGADALFVGPGGLDREALLAALAAVTSRCRLDLGDCGDTVRLLARGREVHGEERWHRVAAPEGREHWRRQHEEAEKAGATGVVVPLSPRLLDLLRNADEIEDRSDLNLAQG
jgi:alkanesulfonate monooxygenase SsuD/methylene tetrahydromethanopterin reductase-like flavin-dependent oxidoreductase (luciferase family)